MPSVPHPPLAVCPPSLIEQASCLERIAAAGDEGLVVADQQGRCVLVNPVALALAGGGAAQFATLHDYLARLATRSRPLDDVWPELKEPAHLEAFARARRILHLLSS